MVFLKNRTARKPAEFPNMPNFLRKCRFRARLLIFCAFAVLPILAGCSFPEDVSRDSVSVMNWNLETFFDGEFDGNEYEEFRSAKAGWSRQKYDKRLERLSSVIRALDCDIIVMEELEKEGQLFDITNRLSGTFDSSKVYRYGYFASEPGSSIGCAVLSRLPIDEVSVHSLDVKSGAERPSMRPIVRATFSVGGRKMDLFVNHWKSKSGGAEKSEFWRDCQERQLSSLILSSVKSGRGVLACGDMNRSIEEFEKIGGKPESNGANVLLKGGAAVFSPWYSASGELSEVGSYWYKNGWEYIDNFFCVGLSLTEFRSRDSGEWCDSQGHPKRYKVYSGSGYSDHLPITCRVSF